jgi:hypothetical protein
LREVEICWSRILCGWQRRNARGEGKIWPSHEPLYGAATGALWEDGEIFSTVFIYLSSGFSFYSFIHVLFYSIIIP